MRDGPLDVNWGELVTAQDVEPFGNIYRMTGVPSDITFNRLVNKNPPMTAIISCNRSFIRGSVDARFDDSKRT